MSTLDFTYYDYLRDAKESGKFIYSIMESFPQGIILTNTEDKIIYANPKVAQMTGYSRKELIGKLSHQFLHFPYQQNNLQDIIDKRIMGVYENYELYIRRKNGSHFLAYTITSPYKDSEEQVIGTISILTDITIKQRDTELQALASGATKSLNAVLITDKFGRIEWVNEGFTRLSGYELYEVIDTTGELLRPENNNLFLEKLSETVRTKKPTAYECRNYNKAGNEYWVSSTVTPVLDVHGGVKEIIIIETDITVHKKMLEELSHLNKVAENSLNDRNKTLEELQIAKSQIETSILAKDRFMASISHEIRTPMNGIIGLIGLLLETNPTMEQQKYLNALKASGETLLVVINDILDISKMDAGKMKFEELPIELSEIIDSAINLFSARTKEKKIQLKKSFHTMIPPFVLGDPIRLNQILYNLLSNAIKFTENGEVELAISNKKETQKDVLIEFNLRDTGCGIPSDKMDLLFLDFTQLNPDTPRKYGGTGLGLAITKRLVELQGGTITVESVVDKGTTFTILMPFKKCNNEQQLAEFIRQKNSEDQLKTLHAKILIAEDNEVNQLLAEKLLKKWGCEIDMASNGKVALNKLEQERYDLLLLDLEMPEFNGYQIIEKIRKSNGINKDIPVIAVTAHADPAEAEKCILAGMNDYILKPFVPRELNLKMIKLLNGAMKHIDLTQLEKVCEGDKAFIKKTINTFIKNLKTDLYDIGQHLQAKKFEHIQLLAHKLKSSVQLFGAKQLGISIKEIEKCIVQKTNMDQLPDLINKATENAEVVIQELKNVKF